LKTLRLSEEVDLVLDNFFLYFDTAGESEGEPDVDEPQTDRSVIRM